MVVKNLLRKGRGTLCIPQPIPLLQYPLGRICVSDRCKSFPLAGI